MSKFGSIVVCDFEYEAADGELPNPLCMVAYVLDEHLKRVRTIKRWRGEFDTAPPFDTSHNTLFVAYAAWAEMHCFLQLGWKFPTHIFDQHAAYIAASNILLPYEPDVKRNKPKKDLHTACRAYGLEGWAGINKKAISEAIGEGRWREYGKEAVLDYCAEDVRMETLLLREQLRGCHGLVPADTKLVIDWSNYSAKVVARIQARGVPIDMEIWHLIQENKTAVIGELLRRFDPSYGSADPIYTPDGQWNYEGLERYLASIGVHSWPRKQKSGRLDIESDTLKLMYHVPGIEGLHALRDSLGVIVRAKLPIGRQGRNRCSLFPFGTATGRNAHSKSIFNAHAGMRSLMVFPRDTIGAYLDWRTQEIGIAAALSGDAALKRDYASGCIYHALALMCGLTSDSDPMHWKKQSKNATMRQRMKTLQLGINYGMGARSLARGLDRHPLIGKALIERHQREYPAFWAWRSNMVELAYRERRVESLGGWPMYLSNSPNPKTLFNFPMQSGGSEMLRLAAWRLCEAGIVPIMLVHDGILLEETDAEKIKHAKEIMRDTGRDVCDGFEIGVDADQMLVGGARYCDKRPVAQAMWRTIMDVLQTVGAMPKRGAA